MRVYLSSTLDDLREEREAVVRLLQDLRCEPVNSYVPDSAPVLGSCLADIDACEVYLLIVGHRYGYVPTADNPGGLSITHLEYRHARARDKACVAVLRQATPVVASADTASTQLQAFRDEVAAAVRPGLFASREDLLRAVSAGITNEKEKQQRRPIARPALRPPQHPVVGRDDLVQRITDRLAAGVRDFAFEYLAGIGKTTLAAQLVRNRTLAARFPDGALWAHLGTHPDVHGQLETWAAALHVAPEAVNACRGSAALSNLLDQAIGSRRLLLVIDDVWSTEAAEPFRIGGPNTARVFTTRLRNVALDLAPRDGLLTVDKLGEDDGFRLLAAIAPDAAEFEPDAVRELVGRVNGMPLALVLIGNLLKKARNRRAEIRRTLHSLDRIDHVFDHDKVIEYPGDADAEGNRRSLRQVIEASYTALGAPGDLNAQDLDGSTLRVAVASLSVLRPDPACFDLQLAAIVSDAPEQALDDLRDAGLIEEVGADDESIAERRFTMHRVIAEYLREKLSLQRIRELNRRAAEHYFGRLRRLEERYQHRGATAYAAWFRYENAEWIESQDHWLYYIARSGGGAQADLAFLRAWFDGFWWWSCFTDEGFDFCDQLLRGWDQRLRLAAVDVTAANVADTVSTGGEAARARRLGGLDTLRRFKAAYPKESADRAAGNWSEVAATLEELRRLAGIDVSQARWLNADARHVRALSGIFLAEAARYGRADLAAAEAHYRESLALFGLAHDDWNSAWVGYHLADMLAGCGRLAEARALAAEALALGRREGDPEVIANLHRVLGDSALADGDTAAALADYRLAVAHAYRFQVEPEMPDAYTVQFYSEVVEQIAERLQRSTAGAGDALAALRANWVDCGAAPIAPFDVSMVAATAASLAEQLFPPALAVERLQHDGAAYGRRVAAHVAALRERHVLPGDATQAG